VTDKIILNGNAIDIASDLGRELTVACVRAGEGLVSDAEVQAEFEINDADWKALAENKYFIRALQKERKRRVNNGSTAREAAAAIYARAPKAMGEILDDKAMSARSRVEAAREIRAQATGGADGKRPADTEKFYIRIDLSGGTGDNEHIIEHEFDKPPVRINTEDSEQPKLTGISNEKFDE
jgi:hypothetical protein